MEEKAKKAIQRIKEKKEQCHREGTYKYDVFYDECIKIIKEELLD